MNTTIDKYEPIFTIGAIASKLNVAVQTVRLYEEEGLVLPFKTRTNRRMYSLHDLERLICIRQMITEHGLNLNGIRKIFSLLPCWRYKKGLDADCLNCPVYHKAIGPCWSIKEVGEKCKTENCRECPVYRLPVNCNSLKEIIYDRVIVNNFSQQPQTSTEAEQQNGRGNS